MHNSSRATLPWRQIIRRVFPGADTIVSLGRAERDRWLARLGGLVAVRSKAKTAEYIRLLANRVEPYQPLWGFPGPAAEKVSRTCLDRMDAMLAYANLPTWRGVRLVDLGCSLGWFSLAFRSRGAIVDGIEMNPTLVTICRQLALLSDFRSDITFHNQRIEKFVQYVIPRRQLDIVLALSVMHHIAHENGFAFARQLTRMLTRNATMCFFEMGLAGEDVGFPWVTSLPQTVEDWFAFAEEDGLEVVKLGEFPTHLSDTMRPLFAVRQQRVWVNGRPYSFDRVSTAAFPGVERPGRRFYFGNTHFVKRLDFDPGEQHRLELESPHGLREEIVREISVHLILRDRQVPNIPRMIDWEIGAGHGSIVFERIGGDLLSEKIKNLDITSLRRVILDVIATVQALEKSHLFHNDIRTYNIIVGDDGRAMLIDFGLAGTREFESNEAALQHLILAAATGRPTTGEYPLPPPVPMRSELGAFADLYDFVGSDRFRIISVSDAFPG